MTRTTLALLVLAQAGCRVTAEAPEALSDAMVTAFLDMDHDEAELAAVLRNMEAQLYRTVPVSDPDTVDRSMSPRLLTEADVQVVSPRPPDADPANAPGIAVAFLSAYEIDQHARIPMFADQAAEKLEPASPEKFDRTFLEGEDCWQDRGCTWLKTTQDVTKKNPLLEIPYVFLKDFRWVDLAAGTDDPEPRWGFVARSWDPDSFSSENGKNTIVQSYTIEVWIPRDGRGFLWADLPQEEQDAADEQLRESDSAGGGTLRLLNLWNETTLSFDVDENIELGTIRWGMDENFKAHETWLADHPE
jgi:hypothetical protein